MNLAPVVVQENEQTRQWRAVCEKCHYFSVWQSQYRTAAAFAKAHRGTRIHKTNSAAPHRFSL